MSPRPALPEGPYLVVGLARSGAAAARMLREHGEVIGCDSGEPEEARALEGVEAHLGSDGVELLERAACVVKSPGVPREAPVVAAARERRLPVVGELELAWRLLENRFLAVTGTNGKTTTVELLGAMYREADLPVAVAGNVGTPLASLVGEVDPRATVVCEVSSFQLEDSDAFAPECAVLLNLAEDHLDRHGSFERYRAAKMRIFERQRDDDVAVTSPGFPAPGVARRVTFGRPGADLELAGERLRWRGEPLLPVAELRLRGTHNLENAMAGAAAALACGVPAHAVAKTLRTFPGVPHRLEEVGVVDGVLFVNDSKATNVTAAVHGIEAFDAPVHAILGGSLKGGGFEGLRDAVSARCAACYLIGQAEERLAQDLMGTTTLYTCGVLPRAVAKASNAAKPGEVVLLSPACASYDQYGDYEERGDHFRSLVPGA